MNERKGFTLVELLAVIVILSIIMIIAIPSVLSTMTTARKKSFVEYVTKVYMAAENKYMAAQTLGDSDLGSSILGAIDADIYYIYNIKTDLGLENVGDYVGYVAVLKPNTTNRPKPRFFVCLSDSNFALMGGTNPFYYYNKEPDATDNVVDLTSEYTNIINIFAQRAATGEVVNLVGFVNEEIDFD